MESEKDLIEQLEERTKKAELFINTIRANLNNIIYSLQSKVANTLTEEFEKYRNTKAEQYEQD